MNEMMDHQSREALQQVVSTGTPTYIATAKALLDGNLSWSQAEIDEFLDGFFNDPYLTRN